MQYRKWIAVIFIPMILSGCVVTPYDMRTEKDYLESDHRSWNLRPCDSLNDSSCRPMPKERLDITTDRTSYEFKKEIIDPESIYKDINPKTSYQKSVLISSIFPGWGWIYECNDPKGPCTKDISPGVWYLLGTAGSSFLLANSINKKDRVGIVGSSATIFSLRLLDIRFGMRAAKRAEKTPTEILLNERAWSSH